MSRAALQLLVWLCVFAALGCKEDSSESQSPEGSESQSPEGTATAVPGSPANPIPNYRANLKDLMAENAEEVKGLKADAQDGVKVLEKVLEDAKAGNPDFATVSKKWNRIDARVVRAEKRLANIVDVGTKYFKAQEAKLKEVKRDDLRTQAQAGLEEKKLAYAAKLKEVRAKFVQMRKIHADVMDVVKVLEVQVSLQFVDKQIALLDQLKEEVNKIISELNTLNAEANKLLGA